ncbi:LTV1 [Candida pseudojiufengensis]|uniref:LTV1 n=1 Tax=Candida pseudojiufengensis TaxID=497109 RepID=UPI0022244AD7|nr:LTV1 [Candida pseudojiufengensis]KAI5961810.1 LTV1 [Candida pseudojiufengensis]
MVKKFDKKNAKTFNIVHRAHDDVKYYDEDASQNVLVESNQSKSKSKLNSNQTTSNNKKIYSTNDLETKLKNKVRDNEGLAAQYGITYDDSNYDYMQHLKPIGDSNDGIFIKAKNESTTEKPQKKLNLEDLLKDNLPSEEKRYISRDLNQSIPDELKGFNPNMDPRLREVLEALEDEAYIEDTKNDRDEEDEEEEGDLEEDDDMFADLLKSGEIKEDEYNEYYDYDDDDYDYENENNEDYDEWDMDNYEDEYNKKYNEESEELIDNKEINKNWQKDFMKFKKDNKNKINEWDSDDEFEEEEEDKQSINNELDEEEEEENDNLGELPVLNKNSNSKSKSKTKLRKKKGSMTDTSSFSMSSSALFRTEGLSLLDDKYEQLNKKYEQKEEESPENNSNSKSFNMKEERNDFENLLDDFLDNYELESGGRKLVKKDKEKLILQKAAKSVSRGKNGDLNKSFKNLNFKE